MAWARHGPRCQRQSRNPPSRHRTTAPTSRLRGRIEEREMCRHEMMLGILFSRKVQRRRSRDREWSTSKVEKCTSLFWLGCAGMCELLCWLPLLLLCRTMLQCWQIIFFTSMPGDTATCRSEWPKITRMAPSEAPCKLGLKSTSVGGQQ